MDKRGQNAGLLEHFDSLVANKQSACDLFATRVLLEELQRCDEPQEVGNARNKALEKLL